MILPYKFVTLLMVDTTESVYYKRRSEIKENERKEERRYGRKLNLVQKGNGDSD